LVFTVRSRTCLSHVKTGTKLGTLGGTQAEKNAGKV